MEGDLQDQSDVRYYTNVSLGGQQFSVLVDTGRCVRISVLCLCCWRDTSVCLVLKEERRFSARPSRNQSSHGPTDGALDSVILTLTP